MAEVRRRPYRLQQTSRRQTPLPPLETKRSKTVAHGDARRVQLGLIWFVAVVGAAAISPFALACVVAAVCAKAADEVIRVRREIHDESETIDLTHIDLTHIDLTSPDPMAGRIDDRRVELAQTPFDLSALSLSELRLKTARIVCDASRLPAILGAAGLPLIASSKGGVDALAISLPLLIIGPLVNRLVLQTQREAQRNGGNQVDGVGEVPGSTQSLAELGLVMIASFTFGLVGAALVLVAQLNVTTAVVLVVLASVYDLGNYLIGTGARSWWEGSVAGAAAVVVVGFASWVAVGPSVGNGEMVAMVGCIAVLCPPGSALASVLLGSADRPARGVRRLDALIVSVPIAAYVVAVLG
ncbi:MAG: hypothetical protein ACSLFB_02915 [Acidimicrobiales bacterium]